MIKGKCFEGKRFEQQDVEEEQFDGCRSGHWGKGAE